MGAGTGGSGAGVCACFGRLYRRRRRIWRQHGLVSVGPREVYVPSYGVSRAYVERVNVSNTTVSTTTVTNIYNTTIVNKTTVINNVTYANQTFRER